MLGSLPAHPFGASEVQSLGLTRAKLRAALSAGRIERVARGVYQLTERATLDPEDAYRTATLRCGPPCCVALLSALDHYHLTDEIPKQTWLVVPNQKRVASADIRAIRLRSPRWGIGIIHADGYWVTSLERTLIDCLVHRRILGSSVAIEALRRSLSEKKTKLAHLIKTAKQLGVLHRVLPYLESFAA